MSGTQATERDDGKRAIGGMARSLMALGLAHAVPMWWATVGDVGAALAATPFSVENWWRMARARTDPEAGWYAWPVALAAVAWRWPRRELRAAMIATAATLLAVDVALAALDFGGGSIRRPEWLTRLPEKPPHLAGTLAAAGALGCVAWLRGAAAGRLRGRRDRRSASRPEAVTGRMALLGAGLFAGSAAFGAAWIGFEELALRSAWLRAQLGAPVASYGVAPTARDPVSARVSQGLALIQSGAAAMAGGDPGQARSRYARGLGILEELAAAEPERATQLAPRMALAFNNLAWLLATCPDESLRDAGRAVRFARRALELAPEDGNTWNTLGVALYRAGEDEESRAALERAMALRDGGTPHDWYFLAMLDARAGDRAGGRRWLERAAATREAHWARDAELSRFEEEAKGTLGEDGER
jgi:hypothetical protein